MTSDPRNIQAFLATNFKSFSLGEVRRKSFEPLLGKGIVSVTATIRYNNNNLISKPPSSSQAKAKNGYIPEQ